MKAKEYLELYRRLEGKIRHCQAIIRELEESRDCIAINLSGMPPSGKKSDPTGSVAIEISVRQDELKAMVRESIDKQKVIMSLLSKLKDGDEYDLLCDRYIHAKSWNDIRKNAYYSEAKVYRVHARALKNFDKILEEHYETKADI